MKYFTFIIIAAVLVSCNQTKTDEQQAERLHLNVHQDSVIGWTIEIPSTWKIQTAEEMAATNQKGNESMEAVVGAKMDPELYKNCLSFSKDSRNMFQSVREKYDEDEAAWRKHNAAIKELFCDVYANQNVQLDSSETVIEEIGGLKFESYEIRFYDDNKKLTMSQIFYSTLLHGYDFSVSMCVTTQENKEELMAIWTNSVFTKPKK